MATPGAPRRGRRVVAVLALLVAVVVTGCGSAGSAGTSATFDRPAPAGVVRVGSADSPEDRLVAEIYATGLQIRGVVVERRFGTASVPLLREGLIDLAPEYTGELLHVLDPQATATAPDEVYRQARAALPPSLTLLDAASAERKDVVVVPRAFAARNSLRSLTDLAPLCPATTIAVPRAVGPGVDLPGGLPAAYGCTFRAVRPVDGDGAVTALRDGEAQAAVLPSTDTVIEADDLVTLDDPRSVVTAQHVVPLIVAAKTADPRVTEVLNKISSQLDTAVLTDLDRRLSGPDGLPASQIARDWLASAGVG